MTTATVSVRSDDVEDSEERIVKSPERVRDLGEVFTPKRTVDDILGMLPGDSWQVHPSKRFLEPGCGDGNFLTEILKRKLKVVADQWQCGKLPAGDDRAALRFHALEALSAIYGVDISPENVFGGVPEHPVGARDRLLRQIMVWYADVTGIKARPKDRFARCADWILGQNVLLGDLLAVETGGDPIPLVAYEWKPENRRVIICHTTFADVLQKAKGKTDLQLFTPEAPVEAWQGPYDLLYNSPVPEIPS